MKKYKYDVALSYAGEDVEIVESVYQILCEEGIDVFFAPECQDELVGAHMDRVLYRKFNNECFFIAAFISDSYINKRPTMLEAKIAINRNKNEKRECLIPFCLEKGVKLPGLNEKIIYLDDNNEVEIADLIIKKVRNLKQLDAENPTVAFSVSGNVVTASFSKSAYSTSSGNGALDKSDFAVSTNNGTITYEVSHIAGSKTATITITCSGLNTGDTCNIAVVLYSNSAFDEYGNLCQQRSHNFTYTQP